MIYTCYEMIRDCRANRTEGWNYFLANYVPVIRRLLAHYAGGDEARLERVLSSLGKPESSLFQSLEPAPERWFVAELRQKAIAGLDNGAAEFELDLATVAEALDGLTWVEKQAAWLESMRYNGGQAGAMLRMAPETVDKIRSRAADLIRAQVDSWNRTMLADNGIRLAHAAAKAATKDCVPAKTFLDMLDGRTTWNGREQLERHANGCWHCVDHCCRLVEVVELLRGIQPLGEEETRIYRRLLGIADEPTRGWTRFFGRG